MRLFDFKILILLGLALVIYFMYKELELHRERLTFCEEKIKELKQITFNENNINPLPPPLPPPPPQHNKVTSIQNTQLITKNKTLSDENKNLSIL